MKKMLLVKLILLFCVFQTLPPALAIKKSYIVYLGSHSHGPHHTDADLDGVTESHTHFLAAFLGSREIAEDAIIYSYRRHINGFAARLDEEEAAQIAQHPDVVSVFPDRLKKLHTTRSGDFLMVESNATVGAASSIWTKARYGEDTIIANIDTGVWPESRSFSDKGYGPIPSRWSGTCHFENQSLCNRKLVGARVSSKGFEEYIGEKLNASYYIPRDVEGHGTHTLSTAAGNFVPGASVFGAGKGTIKGGSPRSRVAAYRVCHPDMGPYFGGCMDADILEGFDAAIEDGVDVVSLSLGGSPANYFEDSIAISSFHAVKKGIVVVASAGNDGPGLGTVSNIAPWLITVAASTVDRKFESDVKLANGVVLQGTSLSQSLQQGKWYPLISGAKAGLPNIPANVSILCEKDSLDAEKVKGKILVCLRGDSDRLSKGLEAKRKGGAGLILTNDVSDGNDIVEDPHFLPATHINYTAGTILFDYLDNTEDPKGVITPVVKHLGVRPAPSVAGFSSRGPNAVTPEILKPDITAPGVNILASYSPAANPTGVPFDHRSSPYSVLSGTSMSCPHVSGVVGLIKTVHPEWSPGVIRSAIMTTARTRDNTGTPIKDENLNATTPLAYGSGHIRPNRALHPGLVYDVSISDYLDLLCGLGYNETLIRQFSGSPHKCPKYYNVLNFNNPALMILGLGVEGRVSLTRKLKNVGKPGSYRVGIRSPYGVTVRVEPRFLKFKRIGEEKTYKVSLRVGVNADRGYGKGQLTWTDGRHYVRSPLVVGVGYPFHLNKKKKKKD